MQGLLYAVARIVPIAAIVISVLFFLRSIDRFRNWRDGDATELWMFLSLILGGFSLLLVGGGLFGILTIEEAALFSMAIGLLIGLISIALGTVYYLRCWQESK
jgi:hypothetical protein